MKKIVLVFFAATIFAAGAYAQCTATIALTSAPGTDAQNVCANTNITDITYAIGGGGTGAGVVGLPAGVSGTFNGGVFTISGTPTVAGSYAYTVTTTGTCNQSTANGTITINPNATIYRTSDYGTDGQSVCANAAITTIRYWIGGATSASVTGLPTGVSGSFAAGSFTISGTPTFAGTYNYTVTTAGSCSPSTATGSITVKSSPTSINITTANPNCGTANGTITLGAVAGGVSPYTYNFNNTGFSTQTNYTGLVAGGYSLIVSDTLGCIYDTVINLNNTGGPTGLFVTSINSYCSSNSFSRLIDLRVILEKQYS